MIPASTGMLALCLVSATRTATSSRVLSLEDAVKTSAQRTPALRQAKASLDAARARADIARAPLLPQVNLSAAYQRSTGNFVARPGTFPNRVSATSTVGAQRSMTETFGFYNFSASAAQTVFDLGSIQRWRASKVSASAEEANEVVQVRDVLLQVRTAYFNARAQRDLVGVAEETLTNTERHLAQVTGFVEVGTRPEIDLAQARTDRANAVVGSIQAQNAYETSKAQLNQAIGVEQDTDYDVIDASMPQTPFEALKVEALFDESLARRSEMRRISEQLRAQELVIAAAEGGYFPTLGVSTALTDAGPALDNLVWNWNAQVILSWSIFQGLSTRSQAAEARANLASLEAQRDALRLAVRFEADQAWLALRAAKASIGAAAEALGNARDRLTLAEGRYEAGVGNSLELSDAQLALTNAAAQAIRANYNLAIARAQLVRALEGN